MKLSFAFLSFLLFASCSNNSSTGSNNNTNSGTAINGGAYVSLSDNLQILSHIKGNVTSYDDSGNVDRVDGYDRDFQGMFGSQQVYRGLIGRPVSWLNSNSQEQGTTALVGSTADTGEVYGFNIFYQNSSQMAIILPQNLIVGQTWEPCAAVEPIQCLLTLKQRMNTYTNTGGTTYSDVLQVYATYLDSSGGGSAGDYRVVKTVGAANLYFARGLGIVEGDIINYEELDSSNFTNFGGGIFVADHKTATATIWRKN